MWTFPGLAGQQNYSESTSVSYHNYTIASGVKITALQTKNTLIEYDCSRMMALSCFWGIFGTWMTWCDWCKEKIQSLISDLKVERTCIMDNDLKDNRKSVPEWRFCSGCKVQSWIRLRSCNTALNRPFMLKNTVVHLNVNNSAKNCGWKLS